MPTKGTSYYRKETLPENIMYIKDTIENRILMQKILGEAVAATSLSGSLYIRVDIENGKWSPSQTFEWLYRDAPPLHSIEEIKEKLRDNKLNKLI